MSEVGAGILPGSGNKAPPRSLIEEPCRRPLERRTPTPRVTFRCAGKSGRQWAAPALEARMPDSSPARRTHAHSRPAGMGNRLQHPFGRGAGSTVSHADHVVVRPSGDITVKNARDGRSEAAAEPCGHHPVSWRSTWPR
ncbi:hypothetical protein ACRAWF_09670 [Streptomyces sp. L7]